MTCCLKKCRLRDVLAFGFSFHRAHSCATFGLRPKVFWNRPDSESGLFIFKTSLPRKATAVASPREPGSDSFRHSSSIKVTEKHYSPWVRDRQEQLEADVRRTWGRATAETKETLEVHEKTDRTN